MRNILNKINNKITNAKSKANQCMLKSITIISDNKGETYLDVVVKSLLAVIIGSLLLAGLYALFNDVVMPELTGRIKDMFNYKG